MTTRLAIRDYRVYSLDDGQSFYDSRDNQVMLRITASQHPTPIGIHFLNKEEDSRLSSQVTWLQTSVQTVLSSAVQQE